VWNRALWIAGLALCLLGCRKETKDERILEIIDAPHTSTSMKAEFCARMAQPPFERCAVYAREFARDTLAHLSAEDDGDCLYALRPAFRFARDSEEYARLRKACCPLHRGQSATQLEADAVCGVTAPIGKSP